MTARACGSAFRLHHGEWGQLVQHRRQVPEAAERPASEPGPQRGGWTGALGRPGGTGTLKQESALAGAPLCSTTAKPSPSSSGAGALPWLGRRAGRPAPRRTHPGGHPVQGGLQPSAARGGRQAAGGRGPAAPTPAWPGPARCARLRPLTPPPSPVALLPPALGGHAATTPARQPPDPASEARRTCHPDAGSCWRAIAPQARGREGWGGDYLGLGEVGVGRGGKGSGIGGWGWARSQGSGLGGMGIGRGGRGFWAGGRGRAWGHGVWGCPGSGRRGYSEPRCASLSLFLPSPPTIRYPPQVGKAGSTCSS